MKKIVLVLLILQSIVSNTSAQTLKWASGVTGNYSYRYVVGDPMQMRFYTLPNGLTVILSVNKETPRVQTLIATKAGSKTDPADHTGLAHYLEHMLFKGTDKYGSLDWNKEKPYLDMIDNLYEQYNSTTDEVARKNIYNQIDSVSGISAKYAIANEYDKMMTMIGAKGTNAFTSFEQTVYVNDIPGNQIDKWIAVEAERYRNPVFRIFHTELEAVYEEKNRSLDDDNDKVFELLFAELFKNHNYGQQTTIGTIPHLKNPSLKAIREYFYKNYVPNNMAIIMVGDINQEEIIGKIATAFGYMKSKPVAPYTYKPEADITSPIIKEVFGPDAESLSMAFRFPGAKSKDALMLDFMSSVLSNGTAGIMDLNIMKQQKALAASAGSYVLQDYSVLFIDGKPKEGQSLEELKDLLLGQLELLKQGKFDDDILKAILNNYKKGIIQQRESNSGRAYAALGAFTKNQDWSVVSNELNEMSKITKKDIQDFCTKYLNNNYVCIYKKQGKDGNTEKVDKPTITPVEVNRNAQSDFVKNVNDIPANKVAPVFVDYNKDIQKGKLKNVEVLSVQNKTNNLYTMYYYLDIGEWHMKILPIAVDYLEYLGTKKYSTEQISKLFYNTAASFGVNGGTEESFVFLSGLQENFKQDVALFEHLIANCEPDENALKEMIAGVKKNRQDEKLNKNIIRSGLSAYARYGAENPFNYGFTNDELDAIKPEELIAVLRKLTQYKHRVLYYGPLSNKALVTALTPLHKTPASFIPTPAKKVFKYQNTTNNQVLFTDYDMVQSELTWVRNGELFDASQMPTIQLFNEYFGGSMSGIVFQEIRESKALAYSTGASYNVPAKKEDPFTVSAYVGCQSDKMKESIAAMNSLLSTLPLSDKVLDQAKSSIMNNIATGRITKTNILFSYLNAQKRGFTEDSRKMVYNNIPQLNMASVNNFHKNKMSNLPYILCVIGSKDKVNMNEMKAFGNITTLSLEQIFGY
jgi:predicted Zn-dependent peptidase